MNPSPDDGHTRPGRVGEIDLLRFVAAMVVVFFHLAFRGHAADARTDMAYPWLAPAAKYGYLGVELFFMISGFVILMTASSGGLRSFVASRLVRLYPGFWAGCTLTALVIVLLGAPRYTVTWGQYLVNMSMLAEFMKVAPIDGVYWSLIVEIKFYLLVGLLLALRRMHQVESFLLGWLALGVAMQVRPVWTVQYWLATEYCAYFAAGAAFYLVWRDGLTAKRAAILLLAWPLALWQSVAALPEFERSLHTHMSRPIVMALVTMCFVAMAVVAWRRTGRLRLIDFTLVGAITYPLYLVHQNIGYIAFNHLHGNLGPHVLFWSVLAGLLLLSYGIHTCVERPVARPARAWLQACLRVPIRH